MSERQPLLSEGSAERSQHSMTKIFSRKRLLTPISSKHGDLVLLVCCFVTGLIDCAAFNNYDAFAGMQTGNTVILFLSTAGYPRGNPYSWATTLVSLASFFIGCFSTARISQWLGPLRRYVITSHFAIQSVLCVIPAVLTLLKIIPTDGQDKSPDLVSDPRIIGALPALAFQSGSTMATSRLLGFSGEIPVNVLTSTYAALATDPKLFAWKNTPRNRRVGAVVCVALGALCAAWIQNSGIGTDVVFWLSGGLKLALALVVWIFMESSDQFKE